MGGAKIVNKFQSIGITLGFYLFIVFLGVSERKRGERFQVTP